MANSNMINPPEFKEGDMEYEEWRKDIKLWSLLTDIPKSKMAIAVHLSLSGRARKATYELTEDELKSEDGLTTLLARLDKLYLQDANWNIFNNYLSFEKFCRDNETSIEDFFYEFDQQYCKLKKCGVDLPEAVLACRLLRSFNLSDVHFQLVLTTISSLTLDDMHKTLKRLFTDDGIICIPKDNEEPLELMQNIKVEPVRISEGYQEHCSNNNKQLEGSSNYCEKIIQKEQDKSHPGERQSITGEMEHTVVNQNNDEGVEHEQDQFYSNRINVKEELPDNIEGIENPDENFDRLDHCNQDHNLNKQNEQQKNRNYSEGIGNPMQTSIHNTESVECWLRRNLCSVDIQNLDQFAIEQTKKQNKGNDIHELRKIKANKIDRNNLQVFQSEMSSQARKSGRRAKLPEKFKEYVYVPPKKKSQQSEVGLNCSSKEKSLESNANIISTSKKQKVFPSKMSSTARKSVRQAKLPEKFKEYLYVPPKKNSHSPKIQHTHSSKERSLELNTNAISTVINQEDVNKGNDILPEGWKKQKRLRSDVSDRNFDIYNSRGQPKIIIKAKNRREMDDNCTVTEGKTPGKQDHACSSTNDEKSCSDSLDKNKTNFSSGYKAPLICPHCPKTFRNIQNNRKYLQHLKGHTNSKIHSCTQCYRSFESEQSLSIHLIFHRNSATIGPFICSYCNKEFDHKFSWQRHVYIFHEKEDSKVGQVCQACKRYFMSKVMFRHHLKIHKEGRERDIICSHCGKIFSHKGNLQRHIVRCVEKKQNPFLLESDMHNIKKENTFSSESNMYKCLIFNCERQFISKVKLKSHMRFHKKRKRSHLCSICNKGFFRSDCRNNHELVCKKKVPLKFERN